MKGGRGALGPGTAPAPRCRPPRRSPFLFKFADLREREARTRRASAPCSPSAPSARAARPESEVPASALPAGVDCVGIAPARPSAARAGAREARTMSGGEVVCSGWLRKSPPEKKLKRYVSTASAGAPRASVPTPLAGSCSWPRAGLVRPHLFPLGPFGTEFVHSCSGLHFDG